MDFKTVCLIVSSLIIVSLAYLLVRSYTATHSSKQKVSEHTDIDQYKKTLSIIADQNLDNKSILLLKRPNNKIPSIFKMKEERNSTKKEAKYFFKKQFGLSDTFLKTLMTEYIVDEQLDQPGIEGGFIATVIKGAKLHGLYGGEDGVVQDQTAVIRYGRYIGADGYKIKYATMAPQITKSTYDGDYTILDYMIEIEGAPDSKVVGNIGRSLGILKVSKTDRGKYRITLRNTMSF